MDVRRLVAGILGIAGGPTVDDMLTGFEGALGIRLFEDLLDHMGSDYMEVFHLAERTLEELEDLAALAENPDVELAQDQFGDSCYAFSLRDAVAFGASLEKMIRGAALHMGRKETSYREHQIYTFNHPLVHAVVGMPVHYSVTDECLLVAFDKGGLIGLRGVLDEMDAVARGEPRTPPEGIEDLVALMDDGYYVVDHAHMVEFTATARDMLVFLREAIQAPPATGGWNSAVGPASDQNLAIVLDLLIGLLDADFDQAGFAARAIYFRENGVFVRNIW